MRKILLLRIYQSWLLLRILFAKLCSLFTSREDFWLISERGKEARDNGYVFYKWMKDNHPEINVKYIIAKDSKDYPRIDISNVIEYNSFKHLLSMWKAKCLISTHIMGFMPDHSIFSRLEMRLHLLKGKKKIFLQHGIINSRLEYLFYGNIDVSLFVSGSQLEYDYITENFGFPEGVVKYTGLCRYDNLNHYQTKSQILIMPTFRMFIDKNYFEDSEYYQTYKELLTCKKFHELLDKYDYTVVFYPHYEFQSKIQSFNKLELSNRITIADMQYDVQELLKESSILITDYSSVFFDMMYMNKPVIFYQFDYTRFRSEHYKEGYINHKDVGPVVDELPSLLGIIEQTLETSGDISNYQSYYDRTFTKRDTNNCYRVYNAIKEII